MKEQTQQLVDDTDQFLKPNEPVETDEYINFLSQDGDKLAEKYKEKITK
ncbi:hypothetical protein [Sutcliffiella cohnii]|nr:hypothetical protein [Sutcliffiella cohnii]